MNATYNIVTNSKAPVFFGGFDLRKFKSFEVEFYVKYHTIDFDYSSLSVVESSVSTSFNSSS